MSFAWPVALFGLIALALPPWIHIRRRRELQRHVVSITRYVDEASPPRRWQSVLEHPSLMLLRMTLICAGVVWLAEPRVDDARHAEGSTWTLVSTATEAGRVANLLEEPNARWLAPGLPPLASPRPAQGAAAVWPALWAADRMAPAGAQFVVEAPAEASALGARRPVLSRPVRWVSAKAEPDDSRAPRLALQIVVDPTRAADAQRLQPVFDAWRDAGLDVALTRRAPGDVDAINQPTIWLSDDAIPPGATSLPAPDVVVTDQTPIDDAAVFALDQRGRVLARATMANDRHVRSVAGLVDADGRPGDPAFAETLLALLFDDAPWVPRPDAPVALAFLTPPVDTVLVPPPTRSLSGLFAVLVLLLAIAERLVAARTFIPKARP